MRIASLVIRSSDVKGAEIFFSGDFFSGALIIFGISPEVRKIFTQKIRFPAKIKLSKKKSSNVSVKTVRFFCKNRQIFW